VRLNIGIWIESNIGVHMTVVNIIRVTGKQALIWYFKIEVNKDFIGWVVYYRDSGYRYYTRPYGMDSKPDESVISAAYRLVDNFVTNEAIEDEVLS
jgi:hypothetical protein